MGITVNTQQFDRALNDALSKRKSKVIKVMQYVGEMCVNEARSNHKYRDQTGNLTSSIGYVVSDNGNIVKQSTFNRVAPGVGKMGKGRGKGSLEGEDFARALATENTNGIALIIVAGMSYAKYVNDRGLNVMDSAEDLGRNLVPKLLSQLK